MPKKPNMHGRIIEYFLLECASSFVRMEKKFTKEIFQDSAILLRNYDHKECSDLCRQANDCISYLFTVHVQAFHERGFEQGCWLFYIGKYGEEKRSIDTNAKFEISCKKLNLSLNSGIYVVRLCDQN